MILASVTISRIGRIHASAGAQLDQRDAQQVGRLRFPNQVFRKRPVYELPKSQRPLLPVLVTWFAFTPGSALVALLCKKAPVPPGGGTVEDAEILRAMLTFM